MADIPEPGESTRASPTTSVEAPSTSATTSSAGTVAAAAESSGYVPLVPPVNKKREDKLRRRDHRALDNIMKTLTPMTTEEKLPAICAKYVELYEQFRQNERLRLATEKQAAVLQREKTQLESDQKKSILARSRLENLCRELQKQNKAVKEEHVAKIREEEERRKEVTSKFQVALSDISNMMQESTEKNMKLREDNINMTNKLSTLCSQFEKRDEQLARVSKQLELEKQLGEARVAKALVEHKADNEKYSIEFELLRQERDLLSIALAESNQKIAILTTNSKALQDQLDLYMVKYEEFEKTINKSSLVFDNCKEEMSNMSKLMTKLEKEAKWWKDRYHINLTKLSELKQKGTKQKDDNSSLTKRVDMLTKLCRQVQTERASYLQLLRQHGIEVANIEEPNIEEASTEEKPTENGELKNIKPQPHESDTFHLGELKSELLIIEKQLEVAQQTVNVAGVADTSDHENVKEEQTEPGEKCAATEYDTQEPNIVPKVEPEQEIQDKQE